MGTEKAMPEETTSTGGKLSLHGAFAIYDFLREL